MSVRNPLTPRNCAAVFYDHPPTMAFGLQSAGCQPWTNSIVAAARAIAAREDMVYHHPADRPQRCAQRCLGPIAMSSCDCLVAG